jgi:4-hydroxybenzoate polyprenyltransferase
VAGGPIKARLRHRRSPERGPMTLPRALLVSLRPHQWTKNLLVVPAALVFSKHLFETDAVLRVCLALVVFCALSGAVYLVNDLADLERDRLHPRKRNRKKLRRESD